MRQKFFSLWIKFWLLVLAYNYVFKQHISNNNVLRNFSGVGAPSISTSSQIWEQNEYERNKTCGQPTGRCGYCKVTFVFARTILLRTALCSSGRLLIASLKVSRTWCHPPEKEINCDIPLSQQVAHVHYNGASSIWDLNEKIALGLNRNTKVIQQVRMYMSCCTMRERADRSLRLPLSYSSINKKWSNVLEGRMNNTSSNDIVAYKLGGEGGAEEMHDRGINVYQGVDQKIKLQCCGNVYRREQNWCAYESEKSLALREKSHKMA